MKRNTGHSICAHSTSLLLICSGFAALSANAQTPTQLPSVEVKGSNASSGFDADTATLGPLGARELLDIPYSVYVVTPEMIKNQHAASLPELMKYLPSTQMEARGGMDAGRPQSRGMRGDVVANIHLDGLNIVSTTAQPIEMMERLEVINSLTGAIYGPANPAGTFNFTQKRPTKEDFLSFSLGHRSREAFSAHIDLGGHVGEKGAVGYRVNLLHEEGEGYVSGSDTKRKLVAGAFDFRLAEQTVLELNASRYEFDKYGFPGGFAYAVDQRLPAAPDASRPGYGQPFAGMELETTTYSARLKHVFSANWAFSASIGRQVADRYFANPTNRLVGNDGDYVTSISAGTVAGRFEIDSNQASLNGHVNTGGIRHELMLSTIGYDWKIYSAAAGSTNYLLGSASIDNPQLYPRQVFTRGSGRFLSGNTRVQSWTLGDTMALGPQWTLMLLANHASFISNNYNLSGVRTGRYDENGLSGTAALTYKPLPRLATYIAWADSLQPGSVAGDTTANPGEVLSPYRSKQVELGAKYNIAAVNIGLALFRLERPFAFTGTDNIFRVQGEQRNKGLELIFSGDFNERWSGYGGATFLDAKLGNTPTPDTSGKRMVGVPRRQAALLSEYRVLEVPGLTVTASLRHTGKRDINTINTARVAGFNIIDLGVRYHQRVWGAETTWRLTVNNLTNKNHWAAIFPGNIDGGVAAGSAFIGDPREVRASMSITF